MTNTKRPQQKYKLNCDAKSTKIVGYRKLSRATHFYVWMLLRCMRMMRKIEGPFLVFRPSKPRTHELMGSTGF